jgi:hypothetical protein
MNMDLWVSSKLQCGLGNRLFQLAAAKQASEMWSIPLVFAMPYCSPSEHGDFNTIFKLFPSISKIWKAEAEVLIEQDGCFKYSPLPSLAPSQRVLLKGFWQSAAYLSDNLVPSWDAIGADDKEVLLNRWCLELKEQRDKTVFLHVRLGDYKILPHHQVPLLGYYARAWRHFLRIPDSWYLVMGQMRLEPCPCFLTLNDVSLYMNQMNIRAYILCLCAAGL